MAQQISLQQYGVHPHVDSIVLWRDPKRSAIWFATIQAAFYFLIKSSGTNLVTLALWTLATLVAGCLAWQYAAQLLGRSGPPVPPILEGFSEESWSRLTTSIRPHVNVALNFLGILVSGKNPVLSLEVLGACIAAAYILKWFSLFGLAYTIVLLAFTLPKAYEMRKNDVDRAVAQLQAKLKELLQKMDDTVLRKIQKHPAKVE